MPAIATPCIQVCQIDPVTELCQGCGRTLREIGGWLSFGEEERARVMADLPARLARAKARAPA